tara:strand:+ start:299 stop:970 length:672 start_codon:yes stop_codon:yes gene_type:complete
MSQISYHIDIVMCIDATGSMKPVIDMVKDNALQFDQRLKAALAEKEKIVDKLRIRLVVYRDIVEDGLDNALLASDFLTLPDEQEKFRDFIESISAFGGGDEPESGLEALVTAMNSPWTREGDKKRHLVVLFTDAPAHKLESIPSSLADYPEDMPKTFEEFVDMWEGQLMDESAKRMLIFAPRVYPWEDVANSCDEVYMIESKAGQGLVDKHYDEIFKGIVNSV